MKSPEKPAARLPAEHLTWAVLLGRWVDFAKSAVALPSSTAGRRIRASVPDIIVLQAVWFALEHLHELDRGERALGLDRAEVLIEKHAGALRKRYRARRMPAALRELVDDAKRGIKSKVEDSRFGA